MNEEKKTRKKIPDPLKAVIAVALFFVCAAVMIGIIVLPDELAKAQDFDTVIIGSSLGKWGINASVLTEETDHKAINLSTGPAAMAGRYDALEGALKRYTPDIVLLEVCFESCTAGELAGWSTNNTAWLVSRMVTPDTAVRYMVSDAKIPWYDYNIVWGAEADASYNAWNHILHGNFDSYKQYAGSGYAEETSNLMEYPEEVIKKAQKETYKEKNINKNLEILKQMLLLCKTYNARPILVSIPTSELYRYYNACLDRFWEELTGIAQEYDCEFYDFNLYKGMQNMLNDSTSFRDLTHLNGESSLKFSELLAREVLAKDREDVTVLEDFYENYEDYRKHSVYSMIRIY
ncbi:MAG: SGNH/GDSL hydrolase family protein [Parasporobacterium sp.]|nr:SGNH/GDSL hydrolase family protein [Parasporobacterium sp.]